MLLPVEQSRDGTLSKNGLSFLNFIIFQKETITFIMIPPTPLSKLFDELIGCIEHGLTTLSVKGVDGKGKGGGGCPLFEHFINCCRHPQQVFN